ncbi:hypothetical protein [Pontivivens ytuae]|uniref:Secreted protein n=1 Tax=Pontivivens ytuae TaxID=2789856 RepID=A0A7S9LVH3_9RHOB|nr:hypothetical protein [Pontivivens ytuae]QPH56019.1 hypothetical protein I0K15_09950 [Pontivivens ytuae]
MSKRSVLLATLAAFLALPALTERDLVPSLENAPNVCADRPAEPDWMQNIALREAYKRVLVQDIYSAQNLERVVEESNCDCDTRFPSWDAAEAVFFERFADAERWEMLEASDEFNRRSSAARPEAMAICEDAGNW